MGVVVGEGDEDLGDGEGEFMEGGQGFWDREGLATVKEYRDIENI